MYRGDGTSCEAGCPFVFEVEPNSNKSQTNLIALASGHAIVGRSTNNVASGGSEINTADYFRVKTEAAPLGVYQHVLTLRSDTLGHSSTVRGLMQSSAPAGPWTGLVGAASVTDATGQTHQLRGTDRVSVWYGFGKEDEVYYRVTGVTGTSALYIATLETTPVTPQNLGTFNAGMITIDTSGQGHTNDTALRVFDSNLVPIHGYANNNASTNGGAPANTTNTSFLRRQFPAGTYYLGIAGGNIATNRGSPSDDNLRTGEMMDFPNVAVDTGAAATTFTDVSFSITDIAGTQNFPASRGGRGEIAWFTFTVTGALVDGACCFPDGLCQVLPELNCLTSGGGIYRGDGTTCAAPCPQSACCLGFGVCVMDWATQCVSQGGLFQGDGTTCAGSACEYHIEIEPNGNKSQSNAVVLAHGHAIVGATTGTSATTGNADLATADVFRVKTAAAPEGIYRHTLTLLSDTAGHSAWIRGLNQFPTAPGRWPNGYGQAPNLGAAATSENNGQPHAVSAGARVNIWYGFGREEEVYYRVEGAAATTALYNATLQTVPVTPVDLGTFNAGVLTISTSSQGHTSDTSLRVYDGQLNPIPGYANDGASTNGGAPSNNNTPSFLRREYSAGTYYVGITIGNLATDQGAPCDDNVRNGPMTDFPNVAVNTFGATLTDVSFSITDSAGTQAFPASRGGRGEIAWFKLTVAGTIVTGSCCLPDGTCVEHSTFVCGAVGGVYGGDGTTCAPNPCPQPGACNLTNGACLVLSAGQCASFNGTYQGHGTACGTLAMVIPETHTMVWGVDPGGQSAIFTSIVRIHQCVIAASELTRIAPGGQITGIAWRNRSGQSSAVPGGINNVEYALYDIQVATSLNPPSSISTTFASNVGSDAVMVREGALSIPSQTFPGGAVVPAAQSFGLLIPFTTPFTYNGGDLVITIRHSASQGQSISLGLDAIGTDTVGQALGYGTLYRAITATSIDSPTGVLGAFAIPMLTFSHAPSCYANCDESTSLPILNVADFTCFLQRFAAGEPYANCDDSTIAPVLNVGDFTCFLQKFAAGCP